MTCPDHPAIARAIATGDTDPEESRTQGRELNQTCT